AENHLNFVKEESHRKGQIEALSYLVDNSDAMEAIYTAPDPDIEIDF
ncbi:unnamed protein product, partial [marine sediment metagenome]